MRETETGIKRGTGTGIETWIWRDTELGTRTRTIEDEMTGLTCIE